MDTILANAFENPELRRLEEFIAGFTSQDEKLAKDFNKEMEKYEKAQEKFEKELGKINEKYADDPDKFNEKLAKINEKYDKEEEKYGEKLEKLQDKFALPDLPPEPPENPDPGSFTSSEGTAAQRGFVAQALNNHARELGETFADDSDWQAFLTDIYGDNIDANIDLIGLRDDFVSGALRPEVRFVPQAILTDPDGEARPVAFAASRRTLLLSEELDQLGIDEAILTDIGHWWDVQLSSQDTVTDSGDPFDEGYAYSERFSEGVEGDRFYARDAFLDDRFTIVLDGESLDIEFAPKNSPFEVGQTLTLPGGIKFKLTEQPIIDDEEVDVKINGELSIPAFSNQDILTQITLDPNGSLKEFDWDVDNLDIPIAGGILLQQVGGGFAAKEGGGYAFEGDLGLTGGPTVTIPLPSWTGLPSEAASALTLDGMANFDQNSLTATLDAVAFNGLFRGDAEVDLNWEQETLSAKVDIDLLDEAFTAEADLFLDSEGDIFLHGEGVVSIPDLLPVFGGEELADGEAYLDFTNDGDLSNDFVAVWGTIDFFGEHTAGVKVNFDGTWNWLRGSEAANEVAQQARENLASITGNEDIENIEALEQKVIGDNIIDNEVPDGVPIIVSGSNNNVDIEGTGNSDNFVGGVGNDTLLGSGGDDILIGAAGTDTLRGGAGNDTLIGVNSLDAVPGLGESDIMTGGPGQDTFVLGDAFNTFYLENGDSPRLLSSVLITDFDVATDKLQVFLRGNQSFEVSDGESRISLGVVTDGGNSDEIARFSNDNLSAQQLLDVLPSPNKSLGNVA